MKWSDDILQLTPSCPLRNEELQTLTYSTVHIKTTYLPHNWEPAAPPNRQVLAGQERLCCFDPVSMPGQEKIS